MELPDSSITGGDAAEERAAVDTAARAGQPGRRSVRLILLGMMLLSMEIQTIIIRPMIACTAIFHIMEMAQAQA